MLWANSYRKNYDCLIDRRNNGGNNNNNYVKSPMANLLFTWVVRFLLLSYLHTHTHTPLIPLLNIFGLNNIKKCNNKLLEIAQATDRNAGHQFLLLLLLLLLLLVNVSCRFVLTRHSASVHVCLCMFSCCAFMRTSFGYRFMLTTRAWHN